jgi:hypothetical protein
LASLVRDDNSVLMVIACAKRILSRLDALGLLLAKPALRHAGVYS